MSSVSLRNLLGKQRAANPLDVISGSVLRFEVRLVSISGCGTSLFSSVFFFVFAKTTGILGETPNHPTTNWNGGFSRILRLVAAGTECQAHLLFLLLQTEQVPGQAEVLTVKLSRRSDVLQPPPQTPTVPRVGPSGTKPAGPASDPWWSTAADARPRGPRPLERVRSSEEWSLTCTFKEFLLLLLQPSAPVRTHTDTRRVTGRESQAASRFLFFLATCERLKRARAKLPFFYVISSFSSAMPLVDDFVNGGLLVARTGDDVFVVHGYVATQHRRRLFRLETKRRKEGSREEVSTRTRHMGDKLTDPRNSSPISITVNKAK